jgi:protease-4
MSKKNCLVITVIVIIIIIILLACAGVCVLFSSAFSDYDMSSTDSSQGETIIAGGEDKIVVINVEGVIMDTESSTDIWGSSYASSNQIVKYLDYAIEDSDVKAVILSMDTPGGDVYASDIIYKKIKEVQASGVKVVSLMRGVAASGGYYISAPADKIVANSMTLTGSIGVLMQFQSMSGLYEKLGIETRVITNSEGEYKTGEGLFDDDPDGEEDKIYQEIVDETFDRFVTIVAEGRGLEKDEVLEFADGRVMTGAKALELGLIDELGDFDTALSVAEELAGITNATVIEYSEYDFWSTLISYVGNIANPTAKLMDAIDPEAGPKLRYLYVE